RAAGPAGPAAGSARLRAPLGPGRRLGRLRGFRSSHHRGPALPRPGRPPHRGDRRPAGSRGPPPYRGPAGGRPAAHRARLLTPPARPEGPPGVVKEGSRGCATRVGRTRMNTDQTKRKYAGWRRSPLFALSLSDPCSSVFFRPVWRSPVGLLHSTRSTVLPSLSRCLTYF